MGTILHLLVALSAAVLQTGVGTLTPPPPPVDEPVATATAFVEPVPAALELVDVPDELVEPVTWAIDLFEQADLTLPPLRIVHHDDRDACGGYLGVHEMRGDRSIVGLCMTEPGPITNSTILHELAHAWLEHQLPTTNQAEFQALRGYEHWRDHDIPWGERGCEQAAEIMVWGLIDRPISFVTFDDADCHALDAGYRALTGTAPLHGYRDLC